MAILKATPEVLPDMYQPRGIQGNAVIAFCFKNAFEAGKMMGGQLNLAHFGILEAVYLDRNTEADHIRPKSEFDRSNGHLLESAREYIALRQIEQPGKPRWLLAGVGDWIVMSALFQSFATLGDTTFKSHFEQVKIDG